MKNWKSFALVGSLIVACAGIVGCGGGGEEAAAAANLEEVAWLEETKASLDSKRVELTEARVAAEAALAEEALSEEGEPVVEEEGSEGEAVEGEGEEAVEAEPPSERVTALEGEISSLSEEFMGRLVTHINAQEMIEGEPLTPAAQAAFRMKSDEDIVVAADWIERGGDYRRAIDIYTVALGPDPDYAKLQEALAYAEDMRYAKAERFAGVEKGMTQEQVREILGPVNLHNVHEYPDKDAVAWFYPKNPTLGKRPPAAVYFQMKDEIYEVYQVAYGIADDEEPEEKE